MMGTATDEAPHFRSRFDVGAYSMNDGDCDMYLASDFAEITVGAYSMNDGDCDYSNTKLLLKTLCRSVFHE